MSENLIQEIYEATAKVLFEGKNKDGEPIMKVLVPIFQSGVETSNKRTYGKALMTKQIERVQADIESGKFLGTSSHNAKLDNVSHIVNKAWMDKNGQGWMEMKIIPTTKGKNLMTIVKEGGRICVSTRGFGNVKNGIVQDDYKLKGIDCVLDGAYEKGTFNKDSVFESMSFDEDDEGTERVKEEIERIETLEQEMMVAMKLIYHQKEHGGYSKSFDEFFAENENLAREHYGLPPKEKKVEEKAKAPSVMKRLKPRDFIFESMMATGLSCTEMAKRHNAVVDIQEARAKFSNESTENEGRLYRMFLEAGLSPSEAREKVEEQRGKPKIKASLSEEEKNLQKEAKKLSEESEYSYDEALKVLTETMKELKDSEANMGAQSLQNILAGKGHASARAPLVE